MSSPIYNIKFIRIDLVEKVMQLPPQKIENPIEFLFNYSVDIKIGAAEKLAVAVTEITISTHQNPNLKLAFFRTLCTFEFPDFESIFKKTEENKYDIPIELEILLKSTGVSTTRGILYTELRGTYFDELVLPLIDIATLVMEQHKKRKETTNI